MRGVLVQLWTRRCPSPGDWPRLFREGSLLTPPTLSNCAALVGGIAQLKEKVSSRCATSPRASSKWEPRTRDLKAMLKLPHRMEAYAVNRAVNSVENDTEECIEPAAG